MDVQLVALSFAVGYVETCEVAWKPPNVPL